MPGIEDTNLSIFRGEIIAANWSCIVRALLEEYEACIRQLAQHVLSIRATPRIAG